jgi:acetyl-CoA synthetase
LEEVTFLGEALPFGETIRLPSWSARSVDPTAYWNYHRKTIVDNKGFWSSVAKELDWFRPWDSIQSRGKHLHVKRWFPGAKVNISHLCLDRHLSTSRKNKLALVWEGEPRDAEGNPREVRKYTYHELWVEVNRVSFLLKANFGLRSGDRAAIYLPMIPELPIFMLALARIGATFTVVFSGFSADSLALRIKDLGARLLITADGFYRRGKLVNLKEIADNAATRAQILRNVLVVKRAAAQVEMKAGRDYWLHELLSSSPAAPMVPPEELDSDHPLFVLYTSGTTGGPKGIIHDHGGYAVLLHATMKEVFDLNEQDVYYCTADIGWVTGHSYIVFGPLIEGTTMIMFEGTPDYPEPDNWWSIIERYRVSVFYTTPTGTRMLMKFSDQFVRRHDLSSLRIIHSVGEPINPSAWRWLFEVVGGKRCPVGSTWWMTETGGILISYAPG